MAKLEGLPDELLVIISEMIQDVRGLASLAKMNRRINVIATRPLYKQTIADDLSKTLFWASATGQIGTLSLLATYGQNMHVIVRGPHESGHPRRSAYSGALDIAARNGQARAAEWLLRHGADIHDYASSVNGFALGPECPVITALSHGKYDVAHVLLSTWNERVASEWETLWCLDGATVWHKALEEAYVVPALRFPGSVVGDYVWMNSNSEAGVAATLTEEERLTDVAYGLLDPVEAIRAYRSQRQEAASTRTPFDDTPEGHISKQERRNTQYESEVMCRWSELIERNYANAACGRMGKLCQRWGQKQCRGDGCFACHLFNIAQKNPFMRD